MENMDYKKEFNQILHEIAKYKRPYEVFVDSLRMATLALYNYRRDQKLEDEYKSIAKKYTPEQLQLIARLLGITYLSLNEGEEELLGHIFMTNNFSNNKKGQFFTPSHIAHFMASIAIDDLKKKNHIYTVCDPAAGAGIFLIEAIKYMKEIKFDYTKYALFFATDIDECCAMMSFVQLALLGAPAVVTWGNSLSNESWWKKETLACHHANIFQRLREQEEREKDKQPEKQKIEQKLQYKNGIYQPMFF
jgi:type I restriction-modification system DNA methylase subunit